MIMANSVTTPVGQLVQGSVYEPQEKDHTGAPLVIKRGPNIGQPTKKWFFALAIKKNDPGWPEFWAQLNGEARAAFPTLFDPAGNCRRPDFAWKILDGDSTVPNQNNKVPAQQEGFPGCHIIRFSSGFAPRCYDSANQPLDGTQVKTGYFVRVACSISGNGDAAKPGMYINPNLVQLCGYGKEIVSGPSAADAFQAPAALPQGASTTPPAPAYGMPAAPAPAYGAPGAAPAPAYGAPPAGYGAPGAAPAPAYGAPPAGPGMPPAAPAPAYGAPPAGPGMPPAYGAPPAGPAAQAPGGYGPPGAAPAPAPAYGFAAGAPEPQFWVSNQWVPESTLRASGYTDQHLAGLPRQ